MAPDVVNWALTFALVLVAVWVGFLIMAAQWLLEHAWALFGFVAAVALLVCVAHRANQ